MRCNAESIARHLRFTRLSAQPLDPAPFSIEALKARQDMRNRDFEKLEIVTFWCRAYSAFAI